LDLLELLKAKKSSCTKLEGQKRSRNKEALLLGEL